MNDNLTILISLMLREDFYKIAVKVERSFLSGDEILHYRFSNEPGIREKIYSLLPPTWSDCDICEIEEIFNLTDHTKH